MQFDMGLVKELSNIGMSHGSLFFYDKNGEALQLPERIFEPVKIIGALYEITAASYQRGPPDDDCSMKSDRK
jgi:hypothetical protein